MEKRNGGTEVWAGERTCLVLKASVFSAEGAEGRGRQQPKIGHGREGGLGCWTVWTDWILLVTESH